MLQIHLTLPLSVFIAAALLALDGRCARRGMECRFAVSALSAWGALNVAFVGTLFFNHAGFPLHLEIMEGSVLQHAERAARLAPLYPDPNPEFVPLAYNPLYYYLAAPFVAAFGPSLTLLRLVSIAAVLICGALIFRIVQRRTGSGWWGFIATALFAAAYRVMDAYLDTAHSDAWFLACALIGSYLLETRRSRARNALGILALVAAFWFKQHGALFVLGGLVYLSLRDGRGAWPYWLLAFIVGPAVYLFAGPALFGSRFHYFTWSVPAAWSEPGWSTVIRYLRFIVRNYFVLAASAVWLLVLQARRGIRKLSVWEVQFVAALLSGLMGALDPGSSDNVFIAMGTWTILMGSMALHTLASSRSRLRAYRADLAGLFVSFGLFAYHPAAVMVAQDADASYVDLLSVLQALPGTVYAPAQGQLAGEYQFYPAVHWVPLEDMLRGPGRETRNQPLTRRLLEPVIEPAGDAYILTNAPLPNLIPALAFLADDYVLVADYGARFIALRSLARRWDNDWPRYLYRFAPGDVRHGNMPVNAEGEQ